MSKKAKVKGYKYTVHTTTTCTCQLSCLGVVGSSPTRGSRFFLGKVTALGVSCCFALIVVCLNLLASFFLPSHLSLKHVYIYILHVHMYITHAPGIHTHTLSTCLRFPPLPAQEVSQTHQVGEQRHGQLLQ